MARPRAVAWLAAVAAIVAVAAVPAARAAPATATAGAADANTIAGGAGGVVRAALTLAAADGGGGGVHWTAADVATAARVGQVNGGGGDGAALRGVARKAATLISRAPIRGLSGVAAAIATVDASSLRNWMISVASGLANARISGGRLKDKYHVFLIKTSIDRASPKSLTGIIYAATWNVGGTSIDIYVFRSGTLTHRARPVLEDLTIYGNDRTTTDRSKSPLIVETFAAP